MKRITKAELVKAILGEVSQDTPRLDVPVTIQDHQFTVELDTATTGNVVFAGLETTRKTKTG